MYHETLQKPSLWNEENEAPLWHYQELDVASKLRKGQKETYQGVCQETYSNIKWAAGISGKYWPLAAFDNNICIFHIWTMGLGG